MKSCRFEMSFIPISCEIVEKEKRVNDLYDFIFDSVIDQRRYVCAVNYVITARLVTKQLTYAVVCS